MTTEFADLLDALGRQPIERLAVCYFTDRFHATVTTVGDAPTVAAAHVDHDCWYSVVPLHERVSGGRGTEADAVGLREVYADLDVKAGGMPDDASAKAVVDDLSAMLGTVPVAIVGSGHGWQPHWRLDDDADGPDAFDWADDTDARFTEALVLMRRWRRLVAKVAHARGGQIDPVYDLARVLRVPGTTNRKNPAAPVPTTLRLLGGTPVSVGMLREALDGYGVPELPEDRQVLGKVLAPATDWTYAATTCHYVAAMIRRWSSDTPTARHPWLVSAAVHLAAAHRSGCLAEKDASDALAAVADRFRWCLTQGQARSETPTELRDAFTWGVLRVSTFTEAMLAAELGEHQHRADPAENPSANEQHPGPTLPTLPTLPEAVWNQHRALTHIRHAAHARNRSADAVLGAVLARVSSLVPAGTVLDTGVGSPATINFYSALVGPAGAGKSTAVGIARDLIPVSWDTPPNGIDPFADDTPLGTGEGIAEAFMGLVEVVTVDDKGKARTKLERRKIRDHAFIFADEGEALTRMLERGGATIGETLRRAWTGETLGQRNGSEERTRVIPRGSYALGLAIGFQLGTIGPLLRDCDAGTPQRFSYWSATDPAIPEVPPPWPGPLHLDWVQLGLPDPLSDAPISVALHLDITPDVIEEIRRRDRARAIGQEAPEPLDAHEPLTRLKLAALLALLDDRTKLTNDDWELSRRLWNGSCAVRDALVGHQQTLAQQQAQARTQVHVSQRRALDDDAHQRALARGMRQAARRVHRHAVTHPEGSCSRKCLTRAVAGSYRVLVSMDDIVEGCRTAGYITLDSDDRFRPGSTAP